MSETILKFFIYSVAGWAIEVLWYFAFNRRFRDKRMLLHLPMCPVYGLGGVLTGELLTAFGDNPVVLFCLGSLTASAAELLFYLVCVLLFEVRVWDYSGRRANFLGGVCALYTVLWGFLAVFVVHCVEPALSDALRLLAPETKLLCVVFLCVITLADMKNTAKVLKNYKLGLAEKLPDCFWYMKKIKKT